MTKAKSNKESIEAKKMHALVKVLAPVIKGRKAAMYTKKLGVKIAFAAKPVDSKKYHVIFGNSEKWAVVADGNVRATRVFDSKDGAIEFAKLTADKINGEVVIHKPTGEIEDRVVLQG